MHKKNFLPQNFSKGSPFSKMISSGVASKFFCVLIRPTPLPSNHGGVVYNSFVNNKEKILAKDFWKLKLLVQGRGGFFLIILWHAVNEHIAPKMLNASHRWGQASYWLPDDWHKVALCSRGKEGIIWGIITITLFIPWCIDSTCCLR